MYNESTVLVTGAAGYIGAHVIKELHHRGLRPVALDDLSSGDRLPPRDVPLITLDLTNKASIAPLTKAMELFNVHQVVHLAALKDANESTYEPLRYMTNGVAMLEVLLEAMGWHDIVDIVYASSAAVHAPELTPYGLSKQYAERALEAAMGSYRGRAVALRLFNVAGTAHPDLADTSETALIPRVFAAAEMATPRWGGSTFTIHGGDYDTPDGTAVRDYIHVDDVAAAVARTLECLNGDAQAPGPVRPGFVDPDPDARDLDPWAGLHAFDVGTGVGTSVKQVVEAVSRSFTTKLDVRYGMRRDGDVASSVADIAPFRAATGWQPRYGLDAIVSSCLF